MNGHRHPGFATKSGFLAPAERNPTHNKFAKLFDHYLERLALSYLDFITLTDYESFDQVNTSVSQLLKSALATLGAVKATA
jgi:hypothetical protein